MIAIHQPGFPRAGARRERKGGRERYRTGDSDRDELEPTGRERCMVAAARELRAAPAAEPHPAGAN